MFELSYDEMILVKDIEIVSLCVHRLLPFRGTVHVGYIPAANGRITGLSKLARLVEVYARRLQIQEHLTGQIADALMGIPVESCLESMDQPTILRLNASRTAAQ